MRIKMNVRSLMNLGLTVVFLYCGARTLMTVAGGQKSVMPEENSNAIKLEPLLYKLEQSFFAEADTTATYDVDRNPLTVAKVKSTRKTKPRPARSSAAKSRSLPRLSGLVLDENPVAIMEIDGVSREVKVGDVIDGNRVIHINGQGVHILIDGEMVVIR